MVLTRSMCKECASIDGGSGATPKPINSKHGMNTVVHGDAARVAVDNHAPARGRRTKSNSALTPQITREDKRARTRSRATVPKSDKNDRSIDRKSSRGTKPRPGDQATKQSRGSKFSTSLAELSESIAEKPQGQNRTHRSGKAGTKRNREIDPDDDAPESEAAPRANARRVRRRLDGIVDQAAKQSNAIIPEISQAHESGAAIPYQLPRRSARLAAKSSNPVPQYRCSSTGGTERIVDRRNQTRRKRARDQGHTEDVSEATSSRHIRRWIQQATAPSNGKDGERTSGSDTKTESSEGTLVGSRSGPSNADRPEHDDEGSSYVPLVKNEDIDQDWLLVIVDERHTSVDRVTPEQRESIEPRSSSVESLLTPPPPCVEEDDQVLLHHDFDAMIPLDAIPDEDERDAMNRAYLRQQQHRPDDEADVEAGMAASRYRSLAPEPDQGLADAIRSGMISGLASPERSMREE
ncbi:hypothetical protein ACEPAH_9255 [Sanghuangporus vaninii]